MEAPLSPQSENNLIVDEQLKFYLRNTAKWAKFLAVVGFIMTALIVIMAFSFGTIMSTFSGMMGGSGMGAMGGVSITILYLILAIVYFIPCLYLYRFAKRTQESLDSLNQDQLLSGVEHLSRFFRFIGVVTIIYLCVIVLAIIAGTIGGIVGASF